jgi:hypothetical protein
VVIACIVASTLRSPTKNLPQIASRRAQIESHDNACPTLRVAVVPDERSEDICSPRERHRWRENLVRHFGGSAGEGTMPAFAVVLTVNTGYWDFFVNWHRHFRANSDPAEHVLIIIAEDASIHNKLEALFDFATSTTIVLPGYNVANDNAHRDAEDYDSFTYKVSELFFINAIFYRVARSHSISILVVVTGEHAGNASFESNMQS